MPVPLALAAAPAAAGLVAYVNARTQLWYDLLLLKCAATGAGRMFYRELRDRLNLFYVLEHFATARASADRPLLLFEGKTYTYAQAYDRVLRYGCWLRTRQGVRPGDIVAIDFQNCETFVWLWFGLWSIGAKPAFLNYNLTGASLVHCIRAATTKLCIIDPHVAANVGSDVREQLPGVRFEVFTPDVEAAAAGADPERAPDAARSDAKLSSMAILIYTSGTTGMPKPAVVSWGKVVVGGSFGEKLLGRKTTDIMYTSMPLYHSSASILSFCAALLGGSTQALGRKFSTKTFWREVRDSKATMIQYVGETLRYLLSAPPQLDPVTGENLDRRHSVRVAFGNGLRPDIWNEFKDRFGVPTIAEFYAATEGSLGTWNVSTNDFTAGAMGRNGWLYNLIMGLQIAVVQVDWDTDRPARDPASGRCARVRPGDPGELLFRLPGGGGDVSERFQGYYNDPTASDAKVARDVFGKGDAWFRTGDVVRWDSEGRVYFVDRIGDTFRWKSENVSTAEVADAVGRHPAVDEANVYGVQLPHHDGRAGCAAVSFAPEHLLSPSGSGSVPLPRPDTLHSLASHVRQRLPRYAQPLFLRVASSMGGGQITGTNKQQKHGLRAAGVDPSPAAAAELGPVYWLKADAYVPFTADDYKRLEAGRVKL